VVKIVVKKEGATQTCGKCGTDLICRLRDYGGAYGSTLQWQNYEGSAHFKTTDGKNYSCNVPDEEEQEQTRISTQSAPPATTPGNPSPAPPQSSSSNLAILNAIDHMNLKLDRIDEMIQAIFRHTVDEQLKKN